MQPNLQPPQGHIGTPEAAKLIGVHQETIRNWVKDEKLEGFKEYDPVSKQHRYWIKREAVEAMMQRSAPQDIETADQMARRTEDVLKRIASQEERMGQRLVELHENLNARLDKVEERQIKVAESLEKAVDILEDLGDRSRQFQDRMLEMLEEEREHLRKQREELGHEEQGERGFWRWLFGQR